ncbi:MAG: adenylate/guanylate cyclase domain-containing protein [Solirubrobacteraceae bacterium]
MEASATTAGPLRTADAAPPRRALLHGVDRRVTVSQCFAHALGAVDVALLLFFVLPAPACCRDLTDHLARNAVALAIYLPLAMAAGTVIGRRLSPTRMAWLRERREPTPEERSRVMRAPNACFKMDAGLWLGAVILFAAVNAPTAAALAFHVAWTLFLGGVTTCVVAHLLLERQWRPITELALAGGPPARPAWPGVEGRLVLAWVLATGGPLLGLVSVGLDGVLDPAPGDGVARSTLVLGLLSLVTGASVTLLVARGVSQPLTAVRKALGRVQAGDLSAEVGVSDGSEVGLLQSGFNSMVGGLRERERMQDLYARQVGADVARAALADEPRLGGEVCEVAILFVDVIGSTSMAAQAPPERVVALLNRFFSVVVDVTAAHGGWVNKFEGDAALCVFGAPVATEDPAGCALAAGRELRRRLDREVAGLQAAIGLSAGPAVAGWIGGLQRFEYTVIGDPVNVASRLSELAKQRPERLLASEEIVSRARAGEREHWTLRDTQVLRGRSTPTRLARPVAR